MVIDDSRQIGAFRIQGLVIYGHNKLEIHQIKGIKISPKEFLLQIAPPPDVKIRDAASLVVEVIGEKEETTMKCTYNLVYEYHGVYEVSALAYLTGVPLSIVSQMLGTRKNLEKGILPPETAIEPDLFLDELAKRDIKINETIMETHTL